MTLNDEEHLGIALEVKAGVADPNSEEISHAVRRAIAEEYHLPVHTVALVAPNSIPRTASGKVQRFIVRDNVLKEIQSQLKAGA
jgi:acyl-coenzyme A synthetase/AMP-(fatty) acid ligase